MSSLDKKLYSFFKRREIDFLKITGDVVVVGSRTVRILMRSYLGHVSICIGADAPVDADAGYAVGCMYIRTNGALYFNGGSVSNAAWNTPGTVGAGSITATLLASDSVITAKILKANVTPIKMRVLTITPITTAGAGTLTAADLFGGAILRTGPTATVLDTTATGTLIETECAFDVNGMWFDCFYTNQSTQTIALKGDTGITLYGCPLVRTLQTVLLRFIRTAANTYTCVVSTVGPFSGFTKRVASAQSVTLTADILLAGYYVHTVITGAATDTLDTGTNLSAAFGGSLVGASFDFIIVNTAATALAITLAGATGTTIMGTPGTIAQNKSARLRFVCTGANTWDIHVLVGA
ncbi:MAG: hypothetical protein QMD92_00285 [bacterium]|nr:hypothetical protein [bacterium]